ncbi:MAG: hypothetical protein JXR61_07525 [Prolixibacteraceae bacterium]|nr:hypothetical protein [Prolixibacteraceae bacterium]
MKKFILLCMAMGLLTIFNGCQKDELGVGQLADEVQPQQVVTPDVYVENGYLAFKNMNAVDSVIHLLNTMTTPEKENWELQMGIKSARAELQELYNEYDKISSKKEMFSFKEKNEANLKFEGQNPEDWSIDYPYATRYFLPVLNSEGVYKVGRSIIKYTKFDQIIIYDGDLEKLNNLDKYATNDNVVFMSGLKSATDENRIFLDDFENDNPDPNQNPNKWYTVGKRRLRNQLIWDNYSYDDGVNRNSGWKLIFHQKGEKKGIFGWRQYKTVYGYQDINFSINYGPSVWIQHNSPLYTPEVYYTSITCASDHANGTTALFYYRPPVTFSAKTYSRGVGIWYTVDH